MKNRSTWVGIILVASWGVARAEQIPNKLIDYEQFNHIVNTSGAKRESRRLTEAQFLAAMKEKGTVVLDARSAHRFAQRHITGAVNLPFTDFTAASLATVIPSKDTKILIYCNNNFIGDPIALESKAPAASLNLSTFTSLKAYGYENVFELGSLLDIRKTALPFSGTLVKERGGS